VTAESKNRARSLGVEQSRHLSADTASARIESKSAFVIPLQLEVDNVERVQQRVLKAQPPQLK
jgi:hypothetical protein